MIRYGLITLVILGLASCTSKAGPFVTNISSDGTGNLTVEKCMVKLDRNLSTVENDDCMSTTIYLSAPHSAKPAEAQRR